MKYQRLLLPSQNIRTFSVHSLTTVRLVMWYILYAAITSLSVQLTVETSCERPNSLWKPVAEGEWCDCAIQWVNQWFVWTMWWSCLYSQIITIITYGHLLLTTRCWPHAVDHSLDHTSHFVIAKISFMILIFLILSQVQTIQSCVHREIVSKRTYQRLVVWLVHPTLLLLSMQWQWHDPHQLHQMSWWENIQLSTMKLDNLLVWGQWIYHQHPTPPYSLIAV